MLQHKPPTYVDAEAQLLRLIEERGPVNPFTIPLSLHIPTEQRGIWLAEWTKQGLIEQVHVIINRGERPPDEIKFIKLLRRETTHVVMDE